VVNKGTECSCSSQLLVRDVSYSQLLTISKCDENRVENNIPEINVTLLFYLIIIVQEFESSI
jgi:hypothetical protein